MATGAIFVDEVVRRTRSWWREGAAVRSGMMLVPLRVMVGALAAAMATCNTPSSSTPSLSATAPAATQESAPPASPPERRFDPDVVRPNPAAPVGQILLALSNGEAERAEAIANQVLPDAPEETRTELYWLAARAALESGAPARAHATLAHVTTPTEGAEHPLAPWARLLRARIMMEGDAALAAEEVAPLTELDWAGRDDARDLQAAAWVEAGEVERAEPLLRALLAESSASSARASVALPLAQLLAQRDEVDAKVEAIRLLRRVATRAPLSSAAREAEERLPALLAALPPERRRDLREPTPEEAFARAEALSSAMRWDDAEAAFHEVAQRAEDDGLQCQARYQEGRAIYYRRQRGRAAQHLAVVARDCAQEEVRAWSRYLAGKAYAASGDHELARQQYGLLEEQTPGHSLADDARYRGALLLGEDGDEDAMVERLRTLPSTYPGGDMHGHARFMLAWRARRAGQREEALAHLEGALAEGTQEDREDLHGRAAYWRAVLLLELERPDEAREAWTELVETHPLSYYAQQALVRLSELSPAAAESARARWGSRGDASITFAWREDFDTPAFGRALALLEVGAIEEAKQELAYVRERSSGADDELRWVEASLYDRAGAYPEAVYLTRRFLDAFLTAPPSGDHYARWRIAYPRAYADVIERAAQDRPVPAELIFAIAREESSFRADAVSVAQAYGLTQLIVPTARRFAQRVDLRATPSTLTQPATNVTIGAEFMSWLWQRYPDNPVVLPAAYNAGQGAVDRWIDERPDQRLDVWVEEIPYDETRRYTRRVLQSWGIYAWLNGAELPPLRPALPSR